MFLFNAHSFRTLSNWDLEFDRWAPSVVRIMWKVMYPLYPSPPPLPPLLPLSLTHSLTHSFTHILLIAGSTPCETQSSQSNQVSPVQRVTHHLRVRHEGQGSAIQGGCGQGVT